jgi:hypothetical protein
MPRLRNLAIVAATGLVACCAFGGQRALAAGAPLPSCTPTLPQTVSSAHFQISYEDDPQVSGDITQSQAGTILAAAERAYASYTAAGFPAPMVGGSGKTEFYIMDLTQWNLGSIYCHGSVVADSATMTGDQMPYTIGVDTFTQVEYSVLGAGSTFTWLMNGAGSWASWRALGYPATSITDLGPFDMALDCESALDKANCSTSNGYENLGESRWPFYEYLTEKYGALFVVDIFNATKAAGGDGLVGLENAIASKGSTLGAEYGAYAAKLLSGNWTATTLDTATMPVAATVLTGTSSGAIPTQSFGINHLATKFIQIDRGDGDASHPCYEATLTLNVQIPAGLTSQPTFYWASGGSSPVPLAVSGNNATATIPNWDTCAWKTHGYLSVPNTSLIDGTSFVVSGTLAVDFQVPATSTVPPAGVTQYGTPIDSSTYPKAPTISLFGPSALSLAPDASQLTIALQSNGEGQLKVTLGSLSLGANPISAGSSAVAFTLPASALDALKAAGSAGLKLTLTPQSPSGAETGTVVARTVVLENGTSLTVKTIKVKPVTKSPHAKSKPKSKAKAKAKRHK